MFGSKKVTKNSLDSIKKICLERDNFELFNFENAELPELNNLPFKINENDQDNNKNFVFKFNIRNSKVNNSTLYVLFNIHKMEEFKNENRLSKISDLEGLEVGVNYYKYGDIYLTVIDNIYITNLEELYIEGIIKAINLNNNDPYSAEIEIIPNEYKDISEYKGIKEVIKNGKSFYLANINVNGFNYPILNNHVKLHFHKHNKTAVSYDIILKKIDIAVQHINVYNDDYVEIIGHDIKESNSGYKIIIDKKDFMLHKYSYIKKIIIYPDLNEVFINETFLKAKICIL